MRHLLIGILAVTVCASMAQTTSSPFSLKAGFATSTGSERSIRLALGAEWRFLQKPEGAFSISAEYFEGVWSGGSYALCVNAIGRKDRFYAEAGIGISFNHESPFFAASHSSRTFALRVAAGVDLTEGANPVFAEISYLWAGSSDHSGIGLFVGVRF